jgi:hypothetical protein
MKKFGLFLFCIFLAVSAQSQQSQVTYTASDAIIANPERGFYAHRESSNGGTLLNKDNLVSLREDENVTLILMLYYLRGFLETPISTSALENMENNFNIMREAGIKCVLRFAYQSSQNNRPYDPTVEQVQEHISQITPIIRRHSDVIAVVQAGFVGVWGEWYYTTNFGFPAPDFVKRNKVVDGLLSALPERRMVQLRTPVLKFGICGITTADALTPDMAYNGSKVARVGHHNDCFLASADDYGTYRNIPVEKAYLEQDTRYLAMGGETCNPSTYSECVNALTEFERFHWSYLNKSYHMTVLNGWVTAGCMDDVKRKLGYRFVLEKGTYTAEARPGGCFNAKIELTNQGWAAPYNPRDMEILLIKSDGSEKYWVRLADNPQDWSPKRNMTMDRLIAIPENISEGTYKVYLNLPDPEPDLFNRPEYAIRLANEGTWDALSGYNDLKTNLVISNSAPVTNCDSGFKFAPFPRVPHLEKYTAIHETPYGTPVKLYPNPVSINQNLVAEFDADRMEEVRLEITSLTGQVVESKALSVSPGYNQITFPFSTKITPGFYVLTIQGSNRYMVKKLSVQE